ncbi:MAG TPA: thiol:disulfide interchange protein DsbA/DsbL [Burkholderiaceae bacterium]|nr:thiol:disulfide interchange protein DsbA/DsbL [Burkholderiaceae bacterium]HQR77091.1 thiol:disulfide interchange protein DsbA/DsbL [Burkholderiaceae bacterium]
MPLTRRHLLLAATVLPALAFANHDSGAGAKKEFVPVSPPQPVETGNQIEVIEFFQYVCPHCASYDPVLQAWKRRLPADVRYRRVPISWDDRNLPHVRLYYTLEALGKTEELQSKVFSAIHVDKKHLLKPEEIAEFMAANGIDRKQWLDAYNSFTVGARANRAGQVWRAYRIDGTPAMAVDGKFVTSPSMVGSREGSIEVLDALIQRARSERSITKSHFDSVPRVS